MNDMCKVLMPILASGLETRQKDGVWSAKRGRWEMRWLIDCRCPQRSEVSVSPGNWTASRSSEIEITGSRINTHTVRAASCIPPLAL